MEEDKTKTGTGNNKFPEAEKGDRPKGAEVPQPTTSAETTSIDHPDEEKKKVDADSSGIRRERTVRHDPNKVEFDFKNIDVMGQLNALVNKDIKITKKSGSEISGMLRTITPHNQLLVSLDSGATVTVYRQLIKKIELSE